MGENVIIFGADMTSSVHTDNKNQDILILGEGTTQGLDDTTFQQKVNILLILHNQVKDLLSLHYNGSSSFLFVNATKIYQFKGKDCEINYYALCLGNI